VIQLDTNPLLRYANPLDADHRLVLDVFDYYKTLQTDLCIVPQNLYEFWTAATRPTSVNGLGFTAEEARKSLDHFVSRFHFIPDSAAICPVWESLVVQYDCKGKVAHDARLVAAMKVHGLNSILTFNMVDFARYPDIAVIDPRTVLPAS